MDESSSPYNGSASAPNPGNAKYGSAWNPANAIWKD